MNDEKRMEKLWAVPVHRRKIIRKRNSKQKGQHWYMK
jgi:hypothetical protein